MEPVPHLDRVASRLNRLALQRAVYRSAGTILLAAAIAGVAAYSLSTKSFGWVVAGLAAVSLVVLVGSFLVLRARWKRRLDAAHWVEDKVDLDQRLLTLVSASAEHDKARLWPELEMDNRMHLVHWGDEKLRIRRIPGNLALLVVGLTAAAISLVPSRDAEVKGMEQAGTSQETGLGEASRSGAVPAPGSGLAEGELAGEGEVGAGKGTTETSQALVRLKSELERRYASSLIAQTLAGDAPGQKPAGSSEPPSRSRADLPESDRNESQAQPGGALPPEGLAHLVQDDGKGKTAARKEPGQGQGSAAGAGGGGKEGKAPNGMREGAGAPAPGSKGKKPGPGEEKVLLSEDATQRSQGTGGGAGNAKATGPLLAPKPLELKGGREAARFALTLGAPPGGQSGSGKDSVPEEPRSYIASGERGEQAEDRTVRRESVPQEYESVIKRIFERSS